MEFCSVLHEEKEGKLYQHVSLNDNFSASLGALVYLISTHYYSQTSSHALFLASIPFFKSFKTKEDPAKEEEVKEEESGLADPVEH